MKNLSACPLFVATIFVVACLVSSDALGVPHGTLLCATLALAALLFLFWQQLEHTIQLARLGSLLPGSEHSQLKHTSLETLEFQLQAVLWELDSLRMQRAVSAEEGSVLPEPLNSETLEAYFSRLAERLNSHFRSVSCCLALEWDGEPLVVRSGVGGVRLETQVAELLDRGAFPNGVTDSSSASVSVGQDFSLFGLGHTVVFPFSFERSSGTFGGALWLGYRSGTKPVEPEVERAELLARDVGRALTAFFQLKALSRRAESAEESVGQKDDYLAHISHDIRTPLNNIRAILHLLQSSIESAEERELTDTALNNCTSLHDIVDGFVEYARHRAGKLIARPEPFSFEECVQEVVESFQISARLKGLELRSDISGTFSCYADKRQARRVVSNLISNAIKYTEFGHVEVGLSAEDGLVSLRVSDSGVGLSEEQQRELFTPFTRFQEGGSEGAGLGLALCQALVVMNEGKISCSSEIGVGSCFTVSFPEAELLEEDREVPEAEVLPFPERREEVSENEIEPKGTSKVLLVDDDTDSAQSLARNLRTYGYDVFTAVTERDALSICNFAKPEFVIADYHMPQGGAKKILADLQHFAERPAVFVLSGSGADEIADEILEQGAVAVLQKPIDCEELCRRLVEVDCGGKGKIYKRKERVRGISGS